MHIKESIHYKEAMQTYYKKTDTYQTTTKLVYYRNYRKGFLHINNDRENDMQK